MLKIAAKTLSWIFHPVLVPTLGLLLLFNSQFYFAMLSWDIKWFVLAIVLFSTAVLPILTFAILAFNSHYNYKSEKQSDKILPLLLSVVYYFFGFYLLNKLSIYPVFKLYLITGILIILGLVLVSFKWKINSHMAGLGGLLGAVMALSFRMGMNPVFLITGICIISGIVGSSQLYLGKSKLLHVISGFVLGLTIAYLTIYFI